MADDKKSSSYAEQGGDAVRETAKWLAVALASVGAVIIAGIQIADLRNVAPPNFGPETRLYLAITGVLVGLLGVGGAIYVITSVLMPGHLTLLNLSTGKEFNKEREFFSNSPEFMRGEAATVPELKKRYEVLLKAYVDARAEDDKGTTANTQAALTVATDQLAAAHEAVVDVLKVGAYEHLRRLFRRELPCMFFFAFLAAAGGALFAWVTGKAAAKSEADSLTSDRVTLELSPSLAAGLKAELGANCDTSALSAVILADNDGALEALVLPVNQCALLRLSLPAGTAKIRAKAMIDRKPAK